MTRIFYDTEFLEDGKVIDLISFGAYCPETGAEFYAVSTQADYARIAQDEWLMKNVMSSIDYQEITGSNLLGQPHKTLYITDPHAMSRVEIRDNLLDWVAAQLKPGELQAEMWAWYGSYDHVALAQLFGKMIELPMTVPMFTMDIKQLHKMVGQPKMPAQPAGLHNALADAKFNAVRYEYLYDMATSRGWRIA